ncbi:GGDEF domain-containing protein [Labedaea rhizosphaerae]|uniref:Diguanylate cyclase (GGDEF)-like protein n=1 Tax=Labedaea rhizosphaerae TaxID=598644 RepID=A0A4V3CZG2_LABRH|nr:GGDEF domain-containing protein [Labedaea rhizosphaerae]TDP97918.1 diguanylate cyclase (GGDEF)-like protein [Labedaea rhizosphaerae]
MQRKFQFRTWGLWSLPKPALAYLLSIEALVVLATGVLASIARTPGLADLRDLGLLMACAAVHVWFSRRAEESRRDNSAGPHVDTTVVWTFPAGILLPPLYAVLLVLWLRVLMYPIRRRPLYRYVFGSAEVVLSVLVTSLVVGLGTPSWDLTASSNQAVAVTAIGAVAYFLIGAIVIAGVIGLTAPKATLSMMIGSRSDNLLLGLMLCLAAVVTLAASWAWLAPLLVVPLLCTGDWAIRQIERLRGDARTDPKTDLLNSRGWNEQAGREIARVRRQGAGGKLAVAILDLDFFKHVNDTWGHPAGDAVLRTVAEVLGTHVREGDVIGRFGGEEFVLLFPDTDITNAVMVAERVRLGISAMSVAATDKRGQPVIIDHRTASIGVAGYEDWMGEPDLEVLLQRADAAVYEAKNGGRDQVRAAEDFTTA